MSRMPVSWLVPTANTYVKTVLGTFGLAGGSTQCHVATPYLPHAFLLWSVRLMRVR